MKRSSFVWLMLVASLSLLTAFGAQPAHAAGAQRGQRFPEMEAALAALRSARNHLHIAATAYGGHRATAERLANQAIAEVREGLSYAQTGRAGAAQTPGLATGQRRPVKGYPEMHAALADLRTAREHLMRGSTKFGGRRVTALKITNQAIMQCMAALRYVHSAP
jgi:hypothetical protein